MPQFKPGQELGKVAVAYRKRFKFAKLIRLCDLLAFQRSDVMAAKWVAGDGWWVVGVVGMDVGRGWVPGWLGVVQCLLMQ